VKCKNCGKRVRFVEDRWYHTWWVQDGDNGSIPAGSAECAWRGRPREVVALAEPDRDVTVAS
jgi:hypothetical protein